MTQNEEYNQLLQSVPLDLIKLSAFSNVYFPENLYKYRAFDEDGKWKAWAEGQIFAGPPAKFNDPFDCSINYSKDSRADIVRHLLLSYMDEHGVKLTTAEKARFDQSTDPIPPARELLKKVGIDLEPHSLFEVGAFDSHPYFQNGLHVASFSEINHSILMWAHYAELHTGFCVGYNFDNIQTVRALTFPVAYSDTMPIIKFDNWKLGAWTFPVTLTKYEIWSYEKEWRFVDPSYLPPINTNILNIPEVICPTVTGIYLGARCDTASKSGKELLSIAEANGTKVYRMKPSTTEFALYPEPL